ncbi:MAG: hypothetical protein ACFB10_10210 [Salibacteraceae bacterium]
MQKLTPVICLLAMTFAYSLVGAQITTDDNTPPLINSGANLIIGVYHHENEEYKKALESYEAITRNDTNYALAMAEKAQTLIALEKYKEAINTCQEGLKLDKRLDQQFYLLMGTAYDEMGRAEEAITAYRDGLKRYPYNQLLNYNLALTLYNEDKLEESKEILIKTIRCNHLYASPHYLLGMICADQGDAIPAMLSLEGYLMRESWTERSHLAVQKLAEIAKVELEPKEGVEPVKTELFSDMELIINSKAALNGGYRTVAKVNDPLIRQTQLLYEKLEYKEGTDNFWMDYYVPTAKKLMSDNQIETFSYWMFASFNAAVVQNWLKKNKNSKVRTFIQWTRKNLEPTGQEMTRNDSEGNGNHWYYESNGKMRALGKSKMDGDFESDHLGEWVYFYYVGSRQVEQTFDDDGLRQGEVKLYAMEGHLKEVSNYKDDSLHGPNIYYNANGLKRAEANYEMGTLKGEVRRYYASGQLRQIIPYSDNDANGMATYYYRNGDKSNEVEFKDDEYHGTFKSFYNNGQLKQELVFEEGDRNGPYKTFYENGQVEAEGTYKNDKDVGVYKSYYDNGQIFTEINYDQEGNATGDVKEFSKEGELTEQFTYVNGKLEGLLTAWDDDGVKHYEYTYKKGFLRYYKYFNKKGEVVAEGKGSKGKMNYVYYTPNGIKRTQGLLKKGERHAVWTFYHASGAVDETTTYNMGTFEGENKTYFRNGKLRSEYAYEGGDVDSYYRRYYSNGKIQREGWYVDDNSEGYWRYYRPDGSLERINYYLNDDLDGYQQYFQVDGKLDYELYIEDGLRIKTISFDTLGEPTDTLLTPNGSGSYMMPHLNAKVRLKGTYKNGLLEGEYKWMNPKGMVTGTVDFYNGERHGMYEIFYDSGKLKIRGFYDNGDLTGDWRWYYPDGSVETEGQYDDKGNRDGLWKWYYENGKLESDGEYDAGSRTGAFTYYNENGTVRFIRYYINGGVQGYSYHGKDGKPVPMIEMPNETGKIVAYYPNGKKSIEQSFEKGYREGRSVLYYENGNIFSDKVFLDDDIDGERKVYYEDGTLKETGVYLYDAKNGKFSFYNEAGKLIREEFYLMGERHGNWKYYDENGSVTKVEKYRYDELYD